MAAISYNLKVRYSDTSAEGMVYYPNYFSWYELAQYEFLTKIGLDFEEMKRRDALFALVETTSRFSAPVKFGDEIRVDMFVRRVNNIKVCIDYEIVRLSDGKTVAETSSVYACIGADYQPKLLNKALPELHKALKDAVE